MVMDSTNIYAYIPFFTFLFTIVVTTYIQAKTRSSRLKDAYIYFSVALTFWIFWDLVLWLRIDESWYVYILKIQTIFWLPVGLLFLNFVNAYLDRKDSKLVKLGMIVYVLAVVVSLSTDYVVRGYRDVFWGVLHEAGPLHAIFSNILVVLPMWFGIYLLLRSVRDKSQVRDQAASMMLLIGTIIGAAISYVTTVYFPDVVGRTDIMPLHDVGIAVHSLFASIAVTRYRFLHIELADVAEDMFARMHDGILILDGRGKIQHANLSAREMLDLGFDELPERNISKYFTGYPESMAFSNYELETSSIGDDSVYSITQAPSVYGKRESGKLVVIRDISEQKKAEKEIRQMNRDLALARDHALESSKMKSQFLANMSHELRTPLNAVIGYSEIIEEEAKDLEQEQIASDADKINRAGKHLLALINDILDLSKIEAGKMDVYIEAFNLNDLLQDVIITSQPMLNKNNNIFEHVIDTSVGLIESDQIKIRQILFNLVSNASKFTQQGKVTLESRLVDKAEGKYLQLQVSDNGIGMTEEQVGKLYNAFTQADASTTRKYGGTGLGMAITRHFVELLKGSIEVKSELGVGTEFIVSIPIIFEEIVSNEFIKKPVRAEKSVDNEDITVLVVDDDEPTRELISRYLEGEGIKVISAQDGADAVDKAHQYRPDLITLDVMMPGKDGWAVLNQLKSDSELVDIPVVMMSMVDNQHLGYALGAAEYLVKPVIRKNLVDVVKRTLLKVPGKQIMIVEDDTDMANLMIALLEEENYQVRHYSDGQSALQQLEINRPSMIVLDLIMPGMNGFEFLRLLRGKRGYGDLPVVVLSSEELTDEVKLELDSVAAEVISKSVVSPLQLVEDIKAMLNVN